MNKDTALKNIRESLKQLLSFSKEVSKFGTLDLTDGTKITTTSDDIEVGAEVYQLDNMGNQTPLEDGDYVLTDGRTFTISDNVIQSIADGEDESSDSTETPTDMKKQELDSNLPEGQDTGGNVPSDMATRLDNLEKSIEDIKSILDKITSTQNSVNEQMMSKIEKFAKEPGAKPIKPIKKESFSYNKVNEKKQELDNLFNFVKSSFNSDEMNNNGSFGSMKFTKLN